MHAFRILLMLSWQSHSNTCALHIVHQPNMHFILSVANPFKSSIYFGAHQIMRHQ